MISANAILIGGINSNEVVPGKRLDSPQVRAALELVQSFQRSTMQSLADVKRVELTIPDVLVAKTAQGSEITFGVTDLDQQLLRWQSIFEKGLLMNKAIASLDLAVSNSIPVTWIDAGAVPQIPIKSLKPLRNRKKHV